MNDVQMGLAFCMLCVRVSDVDVTMGVIGHGGLLRAISFARPIRGSGHV